MSDKYNMNDHKLLWHLDRLKDYRNGKQIAPLNIQLGITNGCNYNCVYCYGLAVMGKTNVADRIDLPTSTIIKFFKDAKEVGVKSISLVGEGENTIHPNFYDILVYAKSINLDLGMASNGVAIDKNRMDEILKSLTWLRFSVGGATKEIYKEIHQRNTFNKFIDIVQNAIYIKRKFDFKTTIGLQMVVMNDNICDIVKLAELGKNLNVDYLVVKPCSDTPNKKLKVPYEKYNELESLFKEAEKYATNNYAVVIKRDKFRNQGYNSFDCCRATNFVIQINAKGDVAPCGHLLGYRKDEFNLGNINEQSFKDIINSDNYKKIQKKVQSLDVNKECETNCLHYCMNQFLQKLENPPQHINFA